MTKATVDWTQEIEVHEEGNVFPARLITADRLDPTNNRTHIVLYTETDGCEYVCAAREDGISVYRNKCVKNKPKNVKGWINVFRGGGGDRIASNIYTDRDKAQSVGQRLKTYIATVPVEWEE